MFSRAAKPDPYATPSPVQFVPPQCDLTIAYLIGKYIAEKENKHAEKVCASPETIRCHLKPVLAEWGHMTLAEFTQGSRLRVKEQCDKWRAGGDGKKPLAQNTVRAYVSKFRTALKYCFDQEIVPEGVPFPKFAMPKAGPPRERVIDPVTEMPRLMEVLNEDGTAPHTRLSTLLFICLGQRRGAFPDLQWSKHIDFERRVIWFKETQELGKRTTKRRTNMPMSDFVYDLLQEAYKVRTCDYVIEWRGRQVKDVYYSVKRALTRAGLGDVVPHDFRRTSATLVHDDAGDMEKAAGHIGDTVAMARKHYVRDNPLTRLPGVEAVSSVVQSALKKAG